MWVGVFYRRKSLQSSFQISVCSVEPCNKGWWQCQLNTEFKDQWCYFSCNLASGRRRLKPFNMQDACMTRWGVLLPQGENTPLAALNQYNYTGNTVERQTWSRGMTSVVICRGTHCWGCHITFSAPLALISHTCVFHVGLVPECFSSFHCVFTNVLNRFFTLVAGGLYFMNTTHYAK